MTEGESKKPQIHSEVLLTDKLPDNVVDEMPEVHDVSLSIVKGFGDKVIVGGAMPLRLRVSCSLACDLRGRTLRIKSQDEVVADGIELVDYDGMVNETEEFVLTAPDTFGEYTWIAVFPAEEKEECDHGEQSEQFSFLVEPHPTSIAVWDVSSPIVFDTTFRFTAGVKCSAGCNLAGKVIEVFDHEDNKVAVAPLGEELYSSAIDLFWVEIELKAPSQEGCYTWKVKFSEADLEIPHDDSTFNFVFSTTKAPDCELTVEVIMAGTALPIEKAQVAIRPNLRTCYTDEQGLVKFLVTKGEYKLSISAGKPAPKGMEYMFGEVPRVTTGHEYMVYVPEENRDTFKPFERTLEVNDETRIKVELVGVVEPPELDTL